MIIRYKGWQDDHGLGLLDYLATVTTHTIEREGINAVHSLGSIHLYVNLSLVDITLTAADQADEWVMAEVRWYLFLSPWASCTLLRV